MTTVLFVDLDGVLTDFDNGVRRATGKLPSEQRLSSMWRALARTKGFYDRLEWLADGRRLWEAVQPASPVILTGLPLGNWAEPQKRSWCRRELGPEVPVITCLSRHKAREAGAWLEERRLSDDVLPVLVDDRLKQREDWEAWGGRFILHYDLGETLRQLEELGLIRTA